MTQNESQSAAPGQKGRVTDEGQCFACGEIGIVTRVGNCANLQVWFCNDCYTHKERVIEVLRLRNIPIEVVS